MASTRPGTPDSVTERQRQAFRRLRTRNPSRLPPADPRPHGGQCRASALEFYPTNSAIVQASVRMRFEREGAPNLENLESKLPRAKRRPGGGWSKFAGIGYSPTVAVETSVRISSTSFKGRKGSFGPPSAVEEGPGPSTIRAYVSFVLVAESRQHHCRRVISIASQNIRTFTEIKSSRRCSTTCASASCLVG